jgi:hypothetical protein
LSDQWTREKIDEWYERLRQHFIQEKGDVWDLMDDLSHLYVEATVEHTRTEAYYELADLFRHRIEDAERLAGIR